MPTTTIRPAPTWMTASEVARLLGVHLQTIRRLTREGKLPYKRVGRSVRFSFDEIEALASRSVTNP